jgi:hypothetical protein
LSLNRDRGVAREESANYTPANISHQQDRGRGRAIQEIPGFIYHDKSLVLSVRYNDRGFIRTQFLVYTPAMTQNPFAAGALNYTFTQRLLTVAGTGTYYIRWTRPNGYQILPPYGDLPNDPWFPRIGFNINPWAPEWAHQLFNPQPPYLLATWVPGKVLTPSIIEFERKQVFFYGGNYPDVLVYSSDYTLKFALAGSPGKGLLYNWKYHQFVAIDPLLARVQVAVSLDPTDICYGFYPYQEPDIVYTDLDVNPFTNQNVRNRIVQFYYKPHSLDPFRTIFYQILNNDGTVFLTNDPDPGYPTGDSGVIFGSMVVGTSRGVQSFETTDIRNRGGGLASQWQAIPQAINFWDLGSLDGKPYPLAPILSA